MLCTTLETAHAAVCKLVHDFAENEAHYLSPGYSEAQARVSFIDKLWQALGWDVTHQQQRNPYAQEVKETGGQCANLDKQCQVLHTDPQSYRQPLRLVLKHSVPKSAANACQIIRRYKRGLEKVGLPKPLIDFINTAKADE